jgi:dCMP deaminase
VNQRGSDWWDNWFLGLAKYISTASKDPSTQVGCVIVGPDREIRATGYNGFPRGIADSEDRLNNRELKYSLVVHGEENALLYAARVGVSLKGCTAYVTWPPCTRCAVSMIQAGISDVFYPAEVEIPERWMKDFTLSQDTLREAGVRVTKVYQESTNSFPVQF